MFDSRFRIQVMANDNCKRFIYVFLLTVCETL